MDIGDIVVIIAGEDRLLGIGLTEDYKYVPKLKRFFPHIREVKYWIIKKKYDDSIPFNIQTCHLFPQ